MSPTSLHRELADRISRLMNEEALAAGARLNENRLAAQLGVSRTPVRAALQHLAALGYVKRRPNVGVELVTLPPMPAPLAENAQANDELLLRIARDRQQQRLPDFVSEAELMAIYGVSRPALRQTLGRLTDMGVVERKLGYGWRFASDGWDRKAREESYRFRLTIEPAAIREPGFALPAGWAEDMRARHEAFLRAPWTESSSVAFFEMNAGFHEGVAAASGNRFFADAVQRQNRLRRLSNYEWRHGRDRVEVNCREHLEILGRLSAGDAEMAALLMRRHLEEAGRLSLTR